MTNPNPRDGASASDNALPDDIEALEAQIAEFETRKLAAEARVRELMASENPAEGVFFAREIFEQQQDKLRLETEILMRRQKIRRIGYGA